MSLSKYRITDILMLLLFGILVEGVFLYLEAFFIGAYMPNFVISFLVIAVLFIRWGPIGGISIPIFALVDWLVCRYLLPGKLGTAEELMQAYNWKVLVEHLVSYSFCFITLAFYNKKNEKIMRESRVADFGFITLLYAGVAIIEGIMVTLLENGDLFINVGYSFLWSIFGYALSTVFYFILIQQNVIVNVKRQIIAQRKEFEEERQYYQNSNTTPSQKKSNEKEGV